MQWLLTHPITILMPFPHGTGGFAFTAFALELVADGYKIVFTFSASLVGYSRHSSLPVVFVAYL